MYKCNNLIKVGDYGRVVIKLDEIMDKYDITRNKLAKVTGIKYSVIDRYYKADNVERVDLEVLAKVCYVLGCDVGDILEYKVDF